MRMVSLVHGYSLGRSLVPRNDPECSRGGNGDSDWRRSCHPLLIIHHIDTHSNELEGLETRLDSYQEVKGFGPHWIEELCRQSRTLLGWMGSKPLNDLHLKEDE